LFLPFLSHRRDSSARRVDYSNKKAGRLTCI
jgi:hypothetical protein